jgi:hypothetical protein
MTNNKQSFLSTLSALLFLFTMWTPAALGFSSNIMTLDLTTAAGQAQLNSGKCISMPVGTRLNVIVAENPSTGFIYYVEQPSYDLNAQAYVIGSDVYE